LVVRPDVGYDSMRIGAFMKVAHITDIHVQTPPRLTDLTGKRLLGTANLYLLGRKSKFSQAAQTAAVEAVVAANPDVVVITGDISAQALDAEFSAARALLDPVLKRFPTVMIPGNHDTYVRENTPGDRMRDLFGDWMGDGSPALITHGDIAFLTLETCRCHPLSSGYTPSAQLAQASELLAKNPAQFTFLCIHYPLVGRDGHPYGPASRALSNGDEVRTWVSAMPGIDAIVHGHEHHGFRSQIKGPNGPISILNPGASGYAFLPDVDRTAHLCFYTIEGDKLSHVDRMRFDGEHFVDEIGGAWASGR
jgi:3',5'-cyclic AMP phosphodiesterase CpdA